MRSIGDPLRALRNELTVLIDDMESKGATMDDVIALIGGGKGRKAMTEGEADNTILACGQVVGMIHDIHTVKELVERIMNEALDIQERVSNIFRTRV
jgi:nitronate monooxygenase